MRTTRALVVLSALAITGCATNQHAGAPSYSQQPLSGTGATLTVKGLSCPQCASNLTLALEGVQGVADADMNLGNGQVQITYSLLPPTGRQLADAVADAGFTLESIDPVTATR